VFLLLPAPVLLASTSRLRRLGEDSDAREARDIPSLSDRVSGGRGLVRRWGLPQSLRDSSLREGAEWRVILGSPYGGAVSAVYGDD